MGIMRFNYRSEAVGGYMDITIVYPTDSFSYYDQTKEKRHHIMPGMKPRPHYKPGMKFQTVYLLHGGGDDDTLTYRYTNAERYAQKNKVMLVTPSIMNSFGVDTEYGIQYSSFLTEELPVLIQTLFASSPKREDNFIMGYAMGGNAALGAAIKRPDLYAACVDMSGGIGLSLDSDMVRASLSNDMFKFKLYKTTFGKPEDFDGGRFDIYTMAKRAVESGVELPKYYFIAGSEEGSIGDRVKKDAEIMKELGYDTTYIEPQGYAHDFELWDKYIRIALDELLPLKRDAIWPEE